MRAHKKEKAAKRPDAVGKERGVLGRGAVMRARKKGGSFELNEQA